jgi:hypothetical protein
MGGDLLLSLKIYGLVIIISMLVAALIRGIVITLSKLQKKPAVPAARAPAAAMPAAAAPDPAQHDIAVIAAALYAMVGAHRIVHIQDRRGAGWAAEGRFAHHASHAIQRKPRNR